MLWEKVHLKESPGRGLGIFATRDIEPGVVVWAEGIFIKKIPKTDFESYSTSLQEWIDKYASYNRSKQEYLLCTDDARFWNHSDDPNTSYIDPGSDDDKEFMPYVIANRLIKAGEELTADYREFCDNCKDGNFGFEIL